MLLSITFHTAGAVWEGFGAQTSHDLEAISSQQIVTHRTVLSPEPDTIVWPSTLTATLNTSPVCPFRVLLHSPDFRSHTLHKNLCVSAERLAARACSHSLDGVAVRP